MALSNFPSFHCGTRERRRGERAQSGTCGTRTTMNTARRRRRHGARPSTANLIWTNMAFGDRMYKDIDAPRRDGGTTDGRTDAACLFCLPTRARDWIGHYTWRREDTYRVCVGGGGGRFGRSVGGMHASRRTMWSADGRTDGRSVRGLPFMTSALGKADVVR